MCVGAQEGASGIMVVYDRPYPPPEARRLLERSLQADADVTLDTCYQTHAVKCEIPEDVEPTRAQRKTCVESYLLEELDTVRPEFILLLGNEAMAAVAGKSGITKHRGNIWRIEVAPGHTSTVMATLSPKAVLKNPKWASAFGMDLTRFGRVVRGAQRNPETKVIIVNGSAKVAELLEVLSTARQISWDIETFTEPARLPFKRTNFQEWHGDDSKVVSISFSVRAGESWVIPIQHPGSRFKNPDEVLRLCFKYANPHAEYIGHNGKFDARWLLAKGISVPQTFDTMIAAHMLDENRLKGLKGLSRDILGSEAYDVGEELKNATQIELRALCVYNAKDTDYTLRLAKVFRRQLSKEERLDRVFTDLMMPASTALAEIERTGVWLDPERWQVRHDQAVENRDILFEWINRHVPVSMGTLNLNSPPQVGRLLFDVLELPILVHTKTGAASTAESILLRLAEIHRVPLAIIKYRKWAKYLSTYLLPWWFEHCDSDGRIHSNYKLYGTVTGRLSGEGGIQQVPRDPFIRSIIGATPGWTFIQADYSQVELRIAAMLSKEDRMIRQFSSGQDVHLIRAQKVTGKLPEDISKEERKRAKAVNFGFIYGMGAPKFVTYAFDSYGVKVSEEEASVFRDGFFEDYPGLRPWHERQRRLVHRYQRVVNPIGRIRHLPDILSLDRGVQSEAERQAINSPVQSFASDLMLIALVRIFNERWDDLRILGTVHDSILFECREGTEARWVPYIKSVMEDMAHVESSFGCEITVPIIADVEVGTHWGETHAFE